MARYDYQCPFGHTLEHSFPIGDAPKTVTCEYVSDDPTVSDPCVEEADRLLATNTSFMINKVMSPPSKRIKPQHLGRR